MTKIIKIPDKPPRKRSVVRYLDRLFAAKLREKLICIQFGTIAYKAQAVAEIIYTVKPDILIKKYEIISSDFIATTRRVYAYIYTNFQKNKYYTDKYERLNPELAAEDREKLEKYFESNLETILNNKKLKKYTEFNNISSENLLNFQYAVALTTQIYSYDTMKLANGYNVSFVADLASRIIISYIVTKNAPTVSELSDWFNDFITDDKITYLKIVHSDRAGSNYSPEIAKMLKKKGIKVSFSDKKNDNQVSERLNRIIRHFIETHKFASLPDDVEFKDLPKREKDIFLKAAVEVYNSEQISNSYAVCGHTRIFVHNAKESIRKAVGEGYSNRIIIAQNNTPEGDFIRKWTECVINLHEIKLFQDQMKEVGLDLPIIQEDEALNLYNIVLVKDNQVVNLKLIEQSEDKELLQEMVLLTKDGINSPEKRERFKELKLAIISKRIERAKTPEELAERQNDWVIAMGDMQTQEALIKQVEVLNKNQIALNTKMDEMSDELKEANEKSDKLAKQLADQSDLIVARTKKINDKRIRKIRKLRASDESLAIMAQDLPIIIDEVESNPKASMFYLAKYILAMIVLKITGLRIMNLRYVNIKQLDNLYNKRDLSVILIKYETFDKQIFPYVPSIQSYLERGRKYYNYIKELDAKKSPLLFYTDTNSAEEKTRALSEIWGNVSRPHFVDTVNKLLQRAETKLKPRKKLSSHSFRRGIGITACNTLGIYAAKYILAHASVTSTERYTQKYPSRTTLKSIMSNVHRVKDSTKMTKSPKVKDSDQAIEDFMNEAVPTAEPEEDP